MNNSYIIATDSTADMYFGYYEANPTIRLPFPFSIAGKDYDGTIEELPIMDFYELLGQGNLIKTSQINQFKATAVFEEILSKGLDILYICFSSGMSGSFDNISTVVTSLKKKYPERRIEIVDTLSGGGGEGIMVCQAKKMQAADKSIDEIVAWIEANKQFMHHIFIVDDIRNIKNSGRISAIAALIGILVHLKPVLEINNEGKVTLMAKGIGRKKAIQAMLKCFEENYEADKNEFIMIGHSGEMAEAEKLGEKIKLLAPGKEIKYSFINYLVAGHSGYNALVIYFFGKPRKK
ncbi:MAG: DegV family protein [Clostridia bacterium]